MKLKFYFRKYSFNAKHTCKGGIKEEKRNETQKAKSKMSHVIPNALTININILSNPNKRQRLSGWKKVPTMYCIQETHFK